MPYGVGTKCSNGCFSDLFSLRLRVMSHRVFIMAGSALRVSGIIRCVMVLVCVRSNVLFAMLRDGCFYEFRVPVGA